MKVAAAELSVHVFRSQLPRVCHDHVMNRFDTIAALKSLAALLAVIPNAIAGAVGLHWAGVAIGVLVFSAWC
jgi:hypothetical protein